jgi:hypothetical protein
LWEDGHIWWSVEAARSAEAGDFVAWTPLKKTKDSRKWTQAERK